MRGILALAIVGGAFGLAWKVGDLLSPDALGMAVGLVFGVMAAIPAGLLILAASRRNDGGTVTVYRAGPSERETRAIAEAAYWRGVAAGQKQVQSRSPNRKRLAGRPTNE